MFIKKQTSAKARCTLSGFECKNLLLISMACAFAHCVSSVFLTNSASLQPLQRRFCMAQIKVIFPQSTHFQIILYKSPIQKKSFEKNLKNDFRDEVLEDSVSCAQA